MHEIVTLQFGNQSNFLGTHFWNAQESYFTYSGEDESLVDHDIHFRPGVGADGSDTFTPRTVIYDLKDNFGNLRQVNALYELQQESNVPAGVWNGTPIIRQRPPIPPHEYQVHLDSGLPEPPISTSSVRFWSDYTRVFYHPRSLVQLHVPTSHLPQVSQTQISPFDKWDFGEDLFQTEDQEHDLLDRDLRPFVEECDQMQGFQIIAGADDAWAGFAGKYVERMRDEFGRRSIWVWGVEEGRHVSQEKRRQQSINLARSAAILTTQATLYIPLSNIPSILPPSYLHMDRASMWHTSALQASALESVTLPSRLRLSSSDNQGTLSNLETTFINDVNRNILQLSFNASEADQELAPELNGTSRDYRMVNGFSEEDDTPPEPEKLVISLFREAWGPGARSSEKEHTFSRVQVSRARFHQGSSDAERPGSRTRRPAYESVVQNYNSNLLFPLPTSYPPIFRWQPAPAGLAVKAALSASTAVASRMRFMADVVGRSVGVEEREELRSELLSEAEEYVDGWEDDEFSDDD